MCEHWSDYKEHCRKPYPEMAYRAMGSYARSFCSSTLNVMLFGVSVVYLLLSSHIINDFVSSILGRTIGFCYTLLIVALLLWPITLLKSPQDFWWAIVVAMLTTLFSVILILVGMSLDYDACQSVAYTPPFQFGNLILSLGTFMFGFGGHAVFPTIQHDMKNPGHFTYSAILAFCIVTAMYAPISMLGYVTYGDSLEESIINSIQTEWIRRGANLFIAMHCILTLTIVINPLNQEVEHLFDIPHHFGWHRIILRSTVMLAVVLTAESVPKFGPILNVIGGTTVALTSAILPSLYNLYLNALTVDSTSKKYKRPSFAEVLERTPKLRLIINIAVIVLAIICGIATTRTAIAEMASTRFTMPCYLTYFGNSMSHLTAESPTHCCGHYRNISTIGNASMFCMS
uniref:Aa_trans domain-containing protein n=1 Tax=Ascaris lumbricoides TaxID=6252 RepID=A0A0M3IMI7_ASCLU